MNIDWATYRITLLLYLGVLFLPVGFYFSYNSSYQIQSDTQILNKFAVTSASILLLDTITDEVKREEKVQKIGAIFIGLEPWISENDKEKFYVSSQSLMLEYNSFIKSWQKADKANREELIVCYQKANSIIFSLNNMIKLKQNRAFNLLFINIFVGVGLFLALIFFIRAFIHKQLSKHAIYDFESKLFTKEYLLVTLKEISARMKRSKEPLSALYIGVDELNSDIIDKKKKEKIVTQVAKALLDTLRESDVACRYNSAEFIVILPNTEQSNVENIIKRLDTYLENLSYTTKSVEYKEDETQEEFMLRIF